MEECARDRFEGLTDGEEALLQAAAGGQFANCAPAGKGPDASENNPQFADSWDKAREIRADLIRWLCTDSEAASRVDPMGIQIAAARISGSLNLSCVAIRFPLRFICCRFFGGVSFSEAELKSLSLDRSHVAAISADSVRVEGNLYLRNGFHAEGMVQLRGASISGNLECDNASFRNPSGMALNANNANVKGAVFLRSGFRSEGEVNVVNAEIGQLDCSRGSFSASSSALNADSVNVRGSVLLQDAFCARGIVRFVRARIGADLSLSGANFVETHFLAERADIAGGLFCQKIKTGSHTIIDLSGASADALDDDPESWPSAGNLDLDGFAYNYLRNPVDARRRLEWLRRQLPVSLRERRDHFHPRPYQQLAKVLRDAGYEKEARRILIGFQRDRDLYEDFGVFAKIGRAIYRQIAYGYEPRQGAFYASIFLVLVGWLFVWAGNRAGLMVPAKTSVGGPDLIPLLYSLDTFLPIHAFRQHEMWWPNAEAWSWCLCGPSKWPWAYLLQIWECIEVSLGWILTGLIVAGFAGIVRRE